jgi:Leucine-rich repeat (LRR) protein
MLELMQAQFVQMASAVVSRIDTMASRLDDLERHIARLDTQASGLISVRAVTTANQNAASLDTIDLTRRLRGGSGLIGAPIPHDAHCLLLCENDLGDLSALPSLPQLLSFDVRVQGDGVRADRVL